MFRRVLSLVMMTAMLAAMIPQAGLALSAEEALFGDTGAPVSADAAVGEAPAAEEAPAVEEAPVAEEAAAAADDDEEVEDDMYSGTTTGSVGEYPTLKLGDADGDDGMAYIVFMQNRLIELGYLNDAADGTFGENTQTAVRSFQKNNGIEPTGVADPATQTKLFSNMDELVPATLDNAIMGSDTTRVQTALAQWGFLESAVDGQYGSGTASAIRRFKKYMLASDPSFAATPTPAPTPTPDPRSAFGAMPVAVDEKVARPLTEDDMSGDIDNLLLSYVDGDKPFVIYRKTVKNGDTGDEVKRVQVRLKHLKYLYKADGAYGALTEGALKYFQRKHGLKESGIADEETQRMLFSPQAMPGEEYVFPYKIVVDISDQRVYIGKWTGAAYTDLVKKMKCSSGTKQTPTPLGTYQSGGKASGEWYFFKEFNCYAKWATRIVGGVLFHSVTYTATKKPSGSVSGLGRRASHGCVRLSVEDAKWIYDNCPEGTTVVIQE